MTADPGLVVLTVGHSTHPIDEFLDILQRHEVAQIADVRTVPKSRHNPQFEGEALGARLGEAGLGYLRMPALGGLRHPRRDSPNGGWRNDSFRGFADYMQTDQFAEAIGALIGIAAERRTVIMCAEAVPWRCHRSMIGDALVVRSVPVLHIMSATSIRPHALHAFARVDGIRVTYPPEIPAAAAADELA